MIHRPPHVPTTSVPSQTSLCCCLSADSTQLVQTAQIRHTVVSDDNDVDTAMQVHLLQAVHQVTDDVIDLSQRVVQLWTGKTR